MWVALSDEKAAQEQLIEAMCHSALVTGQSIIASQFHPQMSLLVCVAQEALQAKLAEAP
jgi:hypothetical protein